MQAQADLGVAVAKAAAASRFVKAGQIGAQAAAGLSDLALSPPSAPIPPQVSPTYCKALYAFEACGDGELPLHVDEVVVRVETQADWTRVRSAAGITGLVPTAYVAPLAPRDVMLARSDYQADLLAGDGRVLLAALRQGEEVVVLERVEQSQWVWVCALASREVSMHFDIC
jgi:hypothetical protein